MVVVAALALARVNAVDLDGTALAHFCAEAEWYVGTRGGIMDHFIAVLGRRDHALFLDCRPYTEGYYKTEHVPLLQGYRLLIADSGVRHQNVKGGYNHRVAACRAAVQRLKPDLPAITHLRDIQGIPWDALAPKLPQQVTVGALKTQGVILDDIPGLTDETELKVRARCRHVWTENERVLSAVRALRAQDAITLGRLLNEAHASARDDYEISCPELEHLVQAAREVDGVLGARLTGAGWGGCIVAVVHADAVSAFKAYVPSRYKELSGIETDVFACRAGPGAGEVAVDAGGQS
jgi:galactokinase